jgi:pSer/pThr/pTyr-binding forkhead associated (FHA) protein
MPSISEARASASRVAKWLLGKSRPEDAVSLLAAWAAAGPNDAEGQKLLAEALQVDPSAKIAQMAFERMEGIAGDHAALEAAIAKFGPEELAKLEKEVARPAFRRAQVGFNNNLKYKGAVYHVQTEDSGLDKPHVITHLFADGGRIIKSTKRSYASEVARDDVALYVRSLMKGQQMEMVLALRDGKYDGIIEGRESSKMDVLDYPPNVDVRRVGERKQQPSAPEAKPEPSSPPPAKPDAKVRFRLIVTRSLSDGPEVYEPAGDDVVIGSAGAVALTGERFCHPREAVLKWRDDRLFLVDLEGGNGAFVRIRTPVELAVGDELIVGDQLLRIARNPTYDHTPGPGPTYCYSSPVRASSYRVVQIFEGGAEGACVVARGTTVYIGSGYNDMIIAKDPLISEHHCLLDEQAGSIILTDLDSKTGVFVRVNGTVELKHGDELLFGRTRLQVDLSAPGT